MQIGFRQQARRTWAQLRLYTRFLLRLPQQHCARHAVNYRAAGILATANGIGYLSFQAFGIPSLTSSELAAICTAAGAMVGGVLAIVLALSVFALQRAADLYSARYYAVFSTDREEQFNFAALALIAVLMFGASIAWSGAREEQPGDYVRGGGYVVLNAVAVAFILVDRQFRRVRMRSNPLYGLHELERRAQRQLRKIDTDARRIAAVTRNLDEAPFEQHVGSAYANHLGPALLQVDAHLEDLLDISMRLADRRELQSANAGVEAFARVIAAYLDFRSKNLIAVPSLPHFPATLSDSHELIGRNLERLNAVGSECIRANREPTTIAVLQAYELLAGISTRLSFPRDNPVSSQVQGYLSEYLKTAHSAWMEEVLFRGISSLRHLAVHAIRNHDNPTTCVAAIDDISDISSQFALRGRFHLLGRSIDSLNELIIEVFANQYHEAEWVLGKIVQALFRLPMQLLASPITGSARGHSVHTTLTKPFEDLPRLVERLAAGTVQPGNDDRQRYHAAFLPHLLDEVKGQLISVAEGVHDCSGPIANSVGHLIEDTGLVLLSVLKDENLPGHANESLRGELHWLIAGIPWRFVRHCEKIGGDTALGSLCDAVAVVGMHAQTMLTEDKLASACIESLDSVVRECLTKPIDSHYTEPRLMKRLVYLGVLAQRYSRLELMEDVGMRIYAFEEAYFERRVRPVKLPVGVDPAQVMGVPRRNELRREVVRWRNGLRRGRMSPPFLRTAESMMFRLVDVEHIDRFIYDLWGIVFRGSCVETEHVRREQNARMYWLRRLTRTLRDAAQAASG